MKYIYLILLFVCSCSKEVKHYEKLYNAKPIPEFLDNDELNPNTDDNIIFKPKRRFFYDYTYKKNDELYKFGVKFNPDCIGKKGVNCFDNFEKPIDSISINNTIDYLVLEVFKTKGHTSLSNKQTIIKYDFFNEKHGKISYGERTGVMENPDKIFLHPPRAFSFSMLQLTPFPYFKLPLYEEMEEWSTSNSIPEETLKHMGMPFESSLFLDFEFQLVGKMSYSSKLGDLSCWKIEAKTLENTEGVEVISTFLFNDEFGFIKMDYNINNMSYLTLELNKVI